jgi:hypothetical protein
MESEKISGAGKPDEGSNPDAPEMRIVGPIGSRPDVPQISLEPLVRILSFTNKASRLRAEFNKTYCEMMAEGVREMVDALPVKRWGWVGARYVEIKGRFFRGRHLKMASDIFDSLEYPEWFSHVEDHKEEVGNVHERFDKVRLAAGNFAKYLNNVVKEGSEDALGRYGEDIKGHVGDIFEAAREYEGAACELAAKLPGCEEDKPKDLANLEAKVGRMNSALAEVGAAACTDGLFQHMPLLQKAIQDINMCMWTIRSLCSAADFKKMIWRSKDFGNFLEKEIGFKVARKEYGVRITTFHDAYASSTSKIPTGERAVYARKYLD